MVFKNVSKSIKAFFGYTQTTRVFVDMDGTLAKFEMVPEEELYKQGYFKNLTPQMPVVDAVNNLAKEKNIELYILSCYLTDSRYAYYEKLAWANKYLPGISCILIPCGQSKADAVRWHTGKAIAKTDILIDDYSKNLHDWEENDGTGVKLMNGINGNNGTWKGIRVSIDKSHDLVRVIKSY